MRQEILLFPGHPIVQDDDFFKLSQDSMLLGGFFRQGRGKRLLDLGCGVGPLMLIALLRFPKLRAVGVDVMEGAAALARENIVKNGLQDRAEVMRGDLRSLDRSLWDAFDLCISNPPYFEPDRGFRSPSETMAAARDGATGGVRDVCRAASRALIWGGRFYVCCPPERLSELFAALTAEHLEPKVLQLVHPALDRPPCLALAEAKKEGGPGLKVCPPLIIRQDGQETEAFRRNYRLEETI